MFQGSMVALVTPMQEDGSADFPALHRLIDFHVDQGSKAIVSVGTTGESATLDMAEHCEIMRETVAYSAGRIPIIAGTGANSTSEAIALTTCAQQAGAQACLLVTPYYNKPTQHGLYLHYKAVAEAVSISQILYNVPGRTACDMLPETVARLSSIDNIIGIKEATGDMQRVDQLIELCDEGFEIYSGDDATAVELILRGGRGNISVTANVVPNKMSQMCLAASQGDAELARSLNEELMAAHKALFLESNPIPVKWALAEMGLIGATIRLPLTVLDEKYHLPVRLALQQVGAL